jgi:hypothetical protein
MLADLAGLRTLLEQLEAHLHRQHAPIVSSWRPGLATGEASSVVEASLGWRLPVEMEVWFQWHNGTEIGASAYFTGSDFQLLSLDKCLARYRLMREIAERLERDDPVFTADEHWHPRWFPFAERLSGDTLFVDSDVSEGDASPVHYYATHDVPHLAQEPSVPSLTDAVAVWVELFERRLWYYDPERSRWATQWEQLDERLRLSDLV